MRRPTMHGEQDLHASLLPRLDLQLGRLANHNCGRFARVEYRSQRMPFDHVFHDAGRYGNTAQELPGLRGGSHRANGSGYAARHVRTAASIEPPISDFTAEGVVRDDQRNALANLGCDEMQGFLFSRPVDALEATRILQDLRPSSTVGRLTYSTAIS